MSKLISIVTPTYNEVENIEILYLRLLEIWKEYPHYRFELIIIDNDSHDGTIEKLKEIAYKNNRVKVILNNKNYGHLRSPYWGMLQAYGDAVVFMASDLQDPPEILPLFIEQWEVGHKIVLGVKPISKSNGISHYLRKLYYRILNKISTVSLVNDATGFGIYDKKVMDLIREINDPNPYFRGLVCELGYPIKTVSFVQASRTRGVTKNNFYTLYEMAMMGFVTYSLIPIRMASLFGIILGGISFILAILLLVIKIVWWSYIPLGIAPIAIGVFFLMGLMLIFIGILGEYVASIIPYVKKRPVVIEAERINF
jgi:glycosyltransferase involved in cell wall biosynthesis